MYAIIETGGKQYRVTAGQTIDVEHLVVAEGSTVELDRVLFLADEGEAPLVGSPTVAGAKVVATAKGDGKNKKVTVFKFKSKVRYHRKQGHRQLFTRLAIDRIVKPVMAEAQPVKRTRRTKKEVKEDGT